MLFSKPIAFLDIESTGVDKDNDRIVELAVIKILPNGDRENKCVLLNPEIAIPPKATEIHHITDDMVKDKPTFRQIAKALNSFLDGCDLGDLIAISSTFLYYSTSLIEQVFTSTIKVETLSTLAIFSRYKKAERYQQP